jgi:hypothetical protein
MKNRVLEALRRTVQIGAPVTLAMAVLIIGADARAVVPTHCVSVDLPAPVTLPDGSIQPAGELRLCLTRNYNPVTGLHRIYIDRMPVMMLLSRASNAEAPDDSRPTVLFHGSLETGLRLVGYNVASNGKVFSYLLWNARAAQGVDVAAGPSGMDGASMTSGSESVLLAARLE